MSTGSARPAPRVSGAEVNYAYQLFMLFLCVYAVISLAAGMLFPLRPEFEALLRYVDFVVCAAFLLDFLLSLFKADNRARYFFTWGWIDLLSSIPAIDALRLGRLARVLRIIRALRAMKAMQYLVRHLAARPASSAFYSIMAVSFSMVVVSALAVLRFEIEAPDASIRTAGDALWWAMATITTVGYGDAYPVTAEGRIVAAALMTAGVGLFGALSGAVAGWFLSPSKRSEISDLHTKIDQMQRDLDRMVSRLGADTSRVEGHAREGDCTPGGS